MNPLRFFHPNLPRVFALACGLLLFAQALGQDASERPRAREAGVIVGVFEPGPLNAITDVEGVRVGHSTVIRGDDIRTGVTAIIPAPVGEPGGGTETIIGGSTVTAVVQDGRFLVIF